MSSLVSLFIGDSLEFFTIQFTPPTTTALDYSALHFSVDFLGTIKNLKHGKMRNKISVDIQYFFNAVDCLLEYYGKHCKCQIDIYMCLVQTRYLRLAY